MNDRLTELPFGEAEITVDGYTDGFDDGYKQGQKDAQPEIIYCKNCIYYRWEIDMCDYPYSTAHNVVHENDFCSKAERRTDE